MKKKYDYFIYYLPLFAFLFIGMGSILLSVSLSSCSSSVKNPLLLCADSLMEVSVIYFGVNFLTTEAVTC